jgi:hypothetical protein
MTRQGPRLRRRSGRCARCDTGRVLGAASGRRALATEDSYRVAPIGVAPIGLVEYHGSVVSRTDSPLPYEADGGPGGIEYRVVASGGSVAGRRYLGTDPVSTGWSSRLRHSSGRSQPGKTQPLSRAVRARFWAGEASRRDEPRSGTRDRPSGSGAARPMCVQLNGRTRRSPPVGAVAAFWVVAGSRSIKSTQRPLDDCSVGRQGWARIRLRTKSDR